MLTLCIIYQSDGMAQKLRRFSNSTVMSYYFGLADNMHKKKGSMFSFRNTSNWKIKSNYGIGFGFGAENHTIDPKETFGENYNLFPVFLDGRYFFDKKLSGAALFFNPGYAIKFDSQQRKGLMLAIGASYPFSRRKHSNWNLNLNYRYQEVNSLNPEFGPTKLHGLGFGVGITFN